MYRGDTTPGTGEATAKEKYEQSIAEWKKHLAKDMIYDTNLPISQAVTNLPISQAVTNLPISQAVTNLPISQAVTNLQISQAVTQEGLTGDNDKKIQCQTPSWWKTWVTGIGDTKVLYEQNKKNWKKLTGQNLNSLGVPLPDILNLSFEDGSLYPTQLIWANECHVKDNKGRWRTMLFAYNLMHVTRQVIVAACEAQTISKRYDVSLSSLVVNPVTQIPFSEATLATMAKTFKVNFQTLTATWTQTIFSKAKTVGMLLGWGLMIPTGGPLTYAMPWLFATGNLATILGLSSKAFFMVSKSSELFHNWYLVDRSVSNKDLERVMQMMQIVQIIPNYLDKVYLGYNLFAGLLSKKEAGGGAQPFDRRFARQINGVEKKRKELMPIQRSDAHDRKLLQRLEHFCEILSPDRSSY